MVYKTLVIKMSDNIVKKTHRGEEEKKIINNRLNRIEGQVKGIIKMINEDRYCNDILIQLVALDNSIKKFIKSYFRKSFI